ncbi:hypothetical protein LINGRAHAP2_LOCUS24221 [Linum grandiflorum]
MCARFSNKQANNVFSNSDVVE